MARPERKHVALTAVVVGAVLVGAAGARNIANEPSTTTAHGTLLVAVPMPGTFDQGVEVSVQADDGTVTPVDVTQSTQDEVAAFAGQDVKVTGPEDGGTITPDSIVPTQARVPQASLQSVMKVAVVLVRPQGSTQVPNFTAATVRANFFGAPPSGYPNVGDWFGRASDTKVAVTGQVFTNDAAPDGFFASTSADTCDLGTAVQQAVAVAHLDSTWTNVVAVYPGGSCPFSGIAWVGWNGVLLNGSVQPTTAEHELGHNLGVWHAGSVNAQGGQYDYGDPTDTMGSGVNRDYSAWHKWRLGWLPDADVQTVTASGATTVTLSSLESPVAGVEMIRAGNYAIDRRSPVGNDASFFGGSSLSGVWVRKLGQSSTSDTVVPLMPDGPVRPLAPGQTFTGDGGVTIKTLTNDPAAPTGQVQVCVSSCVPPPTTTTLPPGTTTTTPPNTSTTSTTTVPPGTGIGYETGDNNDGAPAYASFRVGQTFTVPLAASVSAADFLGFHKGAAGTATCRIYATAGGLPTGQPLATAITSAPVGTVKAWQTCQFPTPASLTAGAQYALVVAWSGGNSSNALIWRNDNTAPTYAGGTRVRSRSSGAWDTTSLLQSEDNLFRVR